MFAPSKKKHLHILSAIDTQRWHSPFSGELRRWRQSRIVEKCVRRTSETEYSEYAIYDAYENYLAGGTVGG